MTPKLLYRSLISYKVLMFEANKTNDTKTNKCLALCSSNICINIHGKSNILVFPFFITCKYNIHFKYIYEDFLKNCPRFTKNYGKLEIYISRTNKDDCILFVPF